MWQFKDLGDKWALDKIPPISHVEGISKTFIRRYSQSIRLDQIQQWICFAYSQLKKVHFVNSLHKLNGWVFIAKQFTCKLAHFYTLILENLFSLPKIGFKYTKMHQWSLKIIKFKFWYHTILSLSLLDVVLYSWLF